MKKKSKKVRRKVKFNGPTTFDQFLKPEMRQLLSMTATLARMCEFLENLQAVLNKAKVSAENGVRKELEDIADLNATLSAGLCMAHTGALKMSLDVANIEYFDMGVAATLVRVDD